MTLQELRDTIERDLEPTLQRRGFTLQESQRAPSARVTFVVSNCSRCHTDCDFEIGDKQVEDEGSAVSEIERGLAVHSCAA